MTFCLTRNYQHTRRKPAGVYRILCIGDSQTFGTGVAIDEALPAQLEALLNRAVWDKQIEVINDAVSGYALYDEWHHFVLRGHRFEPDVLVIILSENDAELFSSQCGPGGPGPYEKHIQQCWDVRSIHLPHFRRMFREIRAQLDESPIPVVIVYYQVYGSPHRDQRSAIVKFECEKNGLDFVDLSAEFSPESSRAYDPNMIVSTADFHPSALAHGMAAQILARHLVKSGYLGDRSAAPMPEPELYRQLLDNAEHMRRAGYRPEFILGHLDQLLTIKRTSKMRGKLPEPDTLDEQAFSALQSDIRSLALAFGNVLLLEAMNYALHRNAEMFFRGRNTAMELINLLSKQLFVLESKLDDPTLWNFRYDPPPESPQKLPSATAYAAHFQAWLQQAIAAQQTLSDGFQGHVGRLPHFDAEMSQRIEQTATSINDYFESGIELADSWINVYGYYRALRERHEKLAAQPALYDAFNSLAADVTRIAALVDKTIHLTHPEKIPLIFARVAPPTATYCVVKLRCAAPEVTTIGVQWQSVVPEFPPIYDVQYIIRDGEWHTHRFRLPLSPAGTIKLIVCPPTEVDLASVECYVDESSIVTLENPLRQTTNGQLWITYPDFVSLI